MTLPNDSKRHTIIGSTGSGKTQLATHTLSLRSITTMPWIVVNFKDDELLNEIPATKLESMSIDKPLKPGVYIVHPDIDDFDGVEQLMMDIWRHTHHGLFIDEALVISQPKHPAYRRLLTQGRSRRCPVISCTQRPVDLDRYAFSEANYISVMRLMDDRETEKIREMTGYDLDMKLLPRYCSYYIDRDENRLTIVRPVPEADEIIETFERRLTPKRELASHLL